MRPETLLNQSLFLDQFLTHMADNHPDWSIVSSQQSGHMLEILYRGEPIFLLVTRVGGYSIYPKSNSFEESMKCKNNYWKKFPLNTGHVTKDSKYDILKQFDSVIKDYMDHLSMAEKIPALNKKNDFIKAMGKAGGKTNLEIENQLAGGGKIVEIKYDKNKNKLRAYHAGHLVVFPTKYRVHDAKYVVDDLVFKNGCYRTIGKIKLLGDMQS